eukprot:m.435295 g.435295  ORF g.435295 m.435295 type:complete len:75 (+) comp17830_c0_seq1:1901-2125(+)
MLSVYLYWYSGVPPEAARACTTNESVGAKVVAKSGAGRASTALRVCWATRDAPSPTRPNRAAIRIAPVLCVLLM